VDVGGTKVSVAVLEAGILSEPQIQPTDTSSTDALLTQLAARIRAAAEGAESAAVGIGIPSVVEWDTGRVKSSVNIPLTDVPLRHALAERTGLEVFVDNDATVAALAEASDDSGEVVHQHLVMLTVGTGIGGGVIINGRIFRGATGAAPEYGHILIGADCEAGAPPHSERAPQPGSLEALAAGRQLDALGRERGFENGPAVVAAAQAGDAQAVDALRILGERLGVGIANAINTFDPEVVCVGGGVSTAGELLLEPARRTAALFVIPGVGERTEIRQARYGPQAGVRGAALLAKHEMEVRRERAALETLS
jgi:glucokinase